MRDRLEIIIDIVRTCERGEFIIKTRIMQICNLSQTQLQIYLKLCIDSGFIETYKGDKDYYRGAKLTYRECYRPTQKGIQFANQLDSALLMVVYNGQV